MDFKVDECIFFQLAKASQAGTRFWSSRVSGMGITAVQAMVMNFLGQGDEVTATDLGRRTALDSATLTGVIDRLESSGLVERKRHPEDRRAILICLTNTGRKIAGELFPMAIVANREFLSGLNANEQKALHKLLGKIRQSSVEEE